MKYIFIFKLKQVCSLSLLLVVFPCLVNGQGFTAFEKSTLSIKTEVGRHVFKVEIARSEQQKMFGLMFRRSLDPDSGMLFDYYEPKKIKMWMKNTLIPLDMIFISQVGKVIHIVERTIPHSEVIIVSKGLARAVLEVNAGTAFRLGIKAGDIVEHPIFGNYKR